MKHIYINIKANTILDEDGNPIKSTRMFALENRATTVYFDFTDCEVDDWEKVVDFELADGSKYQFELGDGVVESLVLNNVLMKEGLLKINPFAKIYDFGSDETLRFSGFTYVLNVGAVVDAFDQETDPMPDVLRQLQDNKADKDSVYTKSETYNKDEVDQMIVGGDVDLTQYSKWEDLNPILDSKVDDTDLSDVAYSGDYEDLLNKPDAPVIDVSEILLMAYPIGSIYISSVNINPSSLFGGVWSSYGMGRTLIGVDVTDPDFNTADKTGGSKHLQQHGHTASSEISSAGSHTHGLNNHTHSFSATSGTESAGHTHSIPALSGTAASNGAHTHTTSGTAASNGAHTHTAHGKTIISEPRNSSYGVQQYINTANGARYWATQADESTVPASRITSSAGAHTHTVSGTAASAGAHTHSVTTTASNTGGASATHTHSVSGTTGGNTGNTTSAGTHSHSATTTINESGTGDSGNLQPYITVYMWERLN